MLTSAVVKLGKPALAERFYQFCRSSGQALSINNSSGTPTYTL
ncbi:MAG: hypothetical protein R2850_06410 [Bacteroidia bacterium]